MLSTKFTTQLSHIVSICLTAMVSAAVAIPGLAVPSETNHADVLATGSSTSTPYKATRTNSMGKPGSPLVKARNGSESEANLYGSSYRKDCLRGCAISTWACRALDRGLPFWGILFIAVHEEGKSLTGTCSLQKSTWYSEIAVVESRPHI
jgi:hypothetical protein